MSKIAYLPEEVIDQIAAGEVVEHPASVVKELVENAIDAKATRISISIKEGGFAEILVEDNGEGMSKEDIHLAIKRHATSKIRKTEDLSTLQTMGFRGEALASIVSISKMEIRSAQNQEGVFLSLQGGSVLQEKEEGKNQGTSICVNSLFYNVPARKAFQKSAASSTKEIIRYMSALALSQDEIEFTLYVEKEKKLFVPLLSSLSYKEKVKMKLELLEKPEIFQGGKWVFFEKEGFTLKGWLSSFETVKKTRLHQYLFINRRWVFSPQISSMIKEMYSTKIEEKGFPCFVLFLDIPLDQVDVNVHPQKKEVRIQNLSLVRKFLWGAFFSTYPNASFINPAFSFPQKEYYSEDISFLEKEETNPLVEEEPFLFSSVFFFHMEGKFLIGTQQEEKKLLLVNVVLLHEALFGSWLQKKEPSSQSLIEPVLIDLSKEEIEEVEFFSAKWAKKAVEVRKISEKSIAVDKIPSFVSVSQVSFFIKELLSFFSSGGKQERKKELKMKRTFSFEEAKALYTLAEKEKVDKSIFQTILTEENLTKLKL